MEPPRRSARLFCLPGGSTVCFGLLAPLAVAACALALGALLPLRFDQRTMQDLERLQNAGIAPGEGILLLSAEPSMDVYRPLRFGMQPLAFPGGTVLWLVPREAADAGSWMGALALDREGRVLRSRTSSAGKLEWLEDEGAADRAREIVRLGTVVSDTSATHAELAMRAPWLQEPRRAFALDTLPGARPSSSSDVSLGTMLVRTLRLWALVGFVAAVWMLLSWLVPSTGHGPWLIACVAAPMAAVLLTGFRYLASLLGVSSPAWSLVPSWLGILAIGWMRQHPVPRLPCLSNRLAKGLLTSATVGFLLLFLASHSLDGDFFYNWLPQAKVFYHFGEHVPAALLERGSMQGASYPPGLGSFFSVLLWATGADQTHPFLISPSSSFCILLYRLVLFLLYASFLGLLASYVRRIAHPGSLSWLVALTATFWLIPLCSGVHSGAESLLFPLLGVSMLLLAWGSTAAAPRLLALGVLVGGLATLFKLEAALLLAAGVLPWALPAPDRDSVRRSVLSTARVLPWLAIALLPTAIWRLRLDVHNEFFRPMGWSTLIEGSQHLPGLLLRALRHLLERGHLALLLIAMPCAVLLRMRRARSWLVLVQPASCVALYVGWIFVYVFTTSEPIVHLDTSYPRLILIPAFSTVLYVAEALALEGWSRRSQTGGLTVGTHHSDTASG